MLVLYLTNRAYESISEYLPPDHVYTQQVHSLAADRPTTMIKSVPILIRCLLVRSHKCPLWSHKNIPTIPKNRGDSITRERRGHDVDRVDGIGTSNPALT